MFIGYILDFDMNNPIPKLFRKFVPFVINLTILFGGDEVINFRHLTVEDHGLSESTIYDVFQDSRGYMWISTDNGLNKYDGHIMKSLVDLGNKWNDSKPIDDDVTTLIVEKK